MRQIETHKCPGLNESVRAEVADVTEEDERKGQLPSKYQFYIKTHEWAKGGRIEFQRGPYKREKDNDPPAQPNGVSDEAVLAVLVDHLQHTPPTRSAEAARARSMAAAHAETALLWLRRAREVE